MTRTVDVRLAFSLVVAASSLTTLACHGDAARRSEAARTSAVDTTSSGAPLPAIETSRFDVPLGYDITRVLADVERVVPKQFGSLDSVHEVGDNSREHYSYVAVRGPFTAFLDESGAHLRATLTYRARGYYKPLIGPTLDAGCGTSTDTPPRIVVELATPLSLNARWHLVSHARLVSLERASTTDRDRCEIRVVHYDVTDRILAAGRSALSGQLPGIDSAIGRVDITGNATGWWRLLSRPQRLADGVWLLLGPERLRIGAVSGKGHVLMVHVGLDARPQIVTGVEPLVAVSTLPPLAHDTISNGFHILMEGIVDYATASRALTAGLRGQSVTEQGHLETVDSLNISPAAGGRLALTATFHGDARGTLRFLGTPRYDATVHAITMPDLDYDLKTDSPLISMYSWARSDVLRSLFREKAVVPDAHALDRGRALLLDGLNRKIGNAMTLTAVIDTVAIRGLYVTPLGLVMRAEATGHASVAVKEQ